MGFPGYSTNENFRKCGEITTAVKVEKKVYSLNCAFCSKVFTKLHTFALHVEKNHDQELLGCFDDGSCKDLSVDERNDDIPTKFNDEKGTTTSAIEINFVDMIKEVEKGTDDFEDPLDHALFEEGPNIANLNVKKDAEAVVHEGEYNDGVNDMETNSETVLENELVKLTDAQYMELIEVYKSFPCLWDVLHVEFRFKNRRQEAMNEMIQKIKKKMNLNFTQDELKKSIHSIQDACKQEKSRKLRCERLKKIFTPLCKFYEQMSFLSDNISPFKCNVCGETFKGYNMYIIHKSTHDNTKPFTCSLCNRGFMLPGNLTVHLRRHTRDYPFECNVCKKRFPNTLDTKMHMRCHTGEKPYFCEICGKSFRTWTFFDTHMRRHQKRYSHICTICSKGFYEKNKLTDHMNVHFNIRDKVCNICGKTFTSLKYLAQHKQIHAEKKKYVCRICGKDFAQAAGLNGHMKSHGTTMSGN